LGGGREARRAPRRGRVEGKDEAILSLTSDVAPRNGRKTGCTEQNTGSTCDPRASAPKNLPSWTSACVPSTPASLHPPGLSAILASCSVQTQSYEAAQAGARTVLHEKSHIAGNGV